MSEQSAPGSRGMVSHPQVFPRSVKMALLLVCLTCSTDGIAMSLLNAGDVWLFSPMEGVITYQGRPAAGAMIVRSVKWKGESGKIDEVKADAAGRFSLLGLMRRAVHQVLPSEFVAYQDIHVLYQGTQYHIWIMSKRDQGKFGELGGEPTNFRCELTAELERVEVDRGLLGTVCRWDSLVADTTLKPEGAL